MTETPPDDTTPGDGTESEHNQPPRPLDGVTVLELGHIVAGPFCTLLLADLGADVIKVEHPDGGDSVRESSPSGNSAFDYVNRNKRSITLDLKHGEGKRVFERLVEAADVVVENYAPGTPERLGVDYDACREHNEGLVYCSLKGFGDGPYRDYPALDPVSEALSGLMQVTGRPGEPPVRVGTSIADMTAGFYGALAVVAALGQRARTGEGQHIVAPLFESTVSLMGYWLAYTEMYDDVPEPLGGGHPNWAPYDVFRTRDDRWVFIGPSSERHWIALCEALETDLHEKPRFDTVADRRENETALNEAIADRTTEFEAATLVARLREAGVPVARINDTREVLADDHLAATGLFTEVTPVHGDAESIRVPGSPVTSSAFETPEGTDPPPLGEHTPEILLDLGFSPAEIEALREEDVI